MAADQSCCAYEGIVFWVHVFNGLSCKYSVKCLMFRFKFGIFSNLQGWNSGLRHKLSQLQIAN